MRSRAGEAATASRKRRTPPPVRSHHDQGHVGVVGGDRVERLDEEGVVLAGLDGADGQEVAMTPAPAGRTAVRSCARSGADSWRGRRGMPWWTARTRSGSAPKLGHHLVGHELGRRVDPGAVGHRPAHQLRVGEGGGVAQLRVADDGQVVDRHDPGGPARSGGRRSWCRGRRDLGPRNHSAGGIRTGARPRAAAGPAWLAARSARPAAPGR